MIIKDFVIRALAFLLFDFSIVDFGKDENS